MHINTNIFCNSKPFFRTSFMPTNTRLSNRSSVLNTSSVILEISNEARSRNMALSDGRLTLSGIRNEDDYFRSSLINLRRMTNDSIKDLEPIKTNLVDILYYNNPDRGNINKRDIINISEKFTINVSAFRNQTAATAAERMIQRKTALFVAHQISKHLLSNDTAREFLIEIDRMMQIDINLEKQFNPSSRILFEQLPHEVSFSHLTGKIMVAAGNIRGGNTSSITLFSMEMLNMNEQERINATAILEDLDTEESNWLIKELSLIAINLFNYFDNVVEWAIRRNINFLANPDRSVSDVYLSSNVLQSLANKEYFRSSQSWFNGIQPFLNHLVRSSNSNIVLNLFPNTN